MKLYIKCTNYNAEEAFDGDAGVRAEMAYTTDDPELLSIYAHDPARMVRFEVARNLKTPIEVLEMMAAEDEDQRVLYRVAINRNTPDDVARELFIRLAQSDDMLVRSNVAGSKRAPGEALALLANDPRWEIRESVASNPNTPTEILWRYIDSGSDCAGYARYNLENRNS